MSARLQATLEGQTLTARFAAGTTLEPSAETSVVHFVRQPPGTRVAGARLRSRRLLLSSEGGGGLAMLLMTRRIMGCWLVGAAAAAASSTCSDFVLESMPCTHRKR